MTAAGQNTARSRATYSDLPSCLLSNVRASQRQTKPSTKSTKATDTSKLQVVHGRMMLGSICAPVVKLYPCPAHCLKPRSPARLPTGPLNGVPSRVGWSHKAATGTAPAEALLSMHSGSSYNSSLWSYDIDDDTFQADVAATHASFKHVGGLGGTSLISSLGGKSPIMAVHHGAVGSSLANHNQHSSTKTDVNFSNSEKTDAADSSSAIIEDASTVEGPSS